MAQLGLVQNLVIRWCHFDCLQSWPPGCVTCIATLPWIALLALSVSIELVSSSVRVTSVKYTQGLLLSHSLTSGPKERPPGLPGSDKKSFTVEVLDNCVQVIILSFCFVFVKCLFLHFILTGFNFVFVLYLLNVYFSISLASAPCQEMCPWPKAQVTTTYC